VLRVRHFHKTIGRPLTAVVCVKKLSVVAGCVPITLTTSTWHSAAPFRPVECSPSELHTGTGKEADAACYIYPYLSVFHFTPNESPTPRFCVALGGGQRPENVYERLGCGDIRASPLKVLAYGRLDPLLRGGWIFAVVDQAVQLFGYQFDSPLPVAVSPVLTAGDPAGSGCTFVAHF